MKRAYTVKKLSLPRKALRASASVTKSKNAIHLFSDVDISVASDLLESYKNRHGIKLSFTGYLVKSLANVIQKHPQSNSFISRNKIIILDDVVISILVERKIGDDYIPEPLILRNVSEKSLPDINSEIREAQLKIEQTDNFGNLSNSMFLKYIPSFLLKAFVKFADSSISMGVKYGKIAITSVGMFGKNPFWVIPHGTATVLLSIGGIFSRTAKDQSEKKYLCLTASFDHDIIDGAPAARFMNDLIDEIKSGNCIRDII